RAHKWRAVRMAAKIHQSAHGKSDNARGSKISIRAGKTKACDRSHDQIGIDSSKGFVTQSHAVEIADWFVLDDYVGVPRNIAESVLSFFGLNIRDYAALICVISGE